MGLLLTHGRVMRISLLDIRKLEAPVADKVTTTIFRSNKTQAVRLPRAVAFPGEVTEVEVIAIGSSRLICPVGHRWDTFLSRETRVPGSRHH